MPNSQPPSAQSVGLTTINASGIAKMAGVGRAAVSNWRRRYSDFPQAIGGTAASPVFDALAVEQWLREQGKIHSVSAQELVWRHIESVSPSTRIGEALCAVGAWLLVESLEAEPVTGSRPSATSRRLPTPRRLLARLRAEHKSLADIAVQVFPEQWPPQFETALSAAEELLPEQDLGAAFEHLHAEFASSSRALSGPDATPDAIADIMLSLTGNGKKVLDFTSGTGSLVYAAVQRAQERGKAVDSYAQEIKPQYALITLLRLWFQYARGMKKGLKASPPVVRIGDSLLDDCLSDVRADVVVANPPFGLHDWGHERLAYDTRWAFGLPPRTEPELAWVQHAWSHLAVGGTAVLLMPPAAAARPAGRRIRGELIRQGALRAVIALPAGLMAPAAVGLHLWVLGRPRPGTPATPLVLFIDGSARMPPATRGADPSDVRETVEAAWRAYLSEPEDSPAEPGVFRVVSAVDVLDGQVDLTPHRYLPASRGPAVEPKQTIAKLRRFDQLLDEVRSHLPHVREAGRAPNEARSTASIADLVRSGSISVVRAGGRPRAAGAEVKAATRAKVITVDDLFAGRPPSGWAQPSQPAEELEADDILVAVDTTGIIARVAAEEHIGGVLGPGLLAFRVDRDVIDPWFLAGVLSTLESTPTAGRISTSATAAPRMDLRRLTIPVLPIEVQRSHGQVFRELALFQVALAHAGEVGMQLARELTDGFLHGALVVRGSGHK